MSGLIHDSSSGSDSEQLADQLDAVVEDLRDAKGPQAEELAYYPANLVGELHDLLPMMKLLAQLGSSTSTTDHDEPHEVHLGDYRILRELGRGGMGYVFEAVQISLNRRVALKILPVASTLDSTSLARFEREAQAAATLEHPHIVRLYARGQEQGTYYLAMQLIRGQDLSQFIRRQREPLNAAAERLLTEMDPTGDYDLATDTTTREFPSAPDKPESTSSSNNAGYYRVVARIGQQVAEALQYAHENGVVHRDIKPSNLLLDEKGGVWVADFGLASLDAANEVTITGKVLGTLRYSSPEQASGRRDLDARTDVYSLGASLYELSTLHPAFASRPPAAMLNAILEEEPERPRKLAPKLPHDLESVILKAMAKSPRHRYQTALELAVDLQRFLRNEPVQAKRPKLLERSVRWVQRNRAMSLLTCVIMLLMISGLLGSVAHFSRQTELLTRLDDSNTRLTRTLTDLKQTLEHEERLRHTVEAEERLSRERYYAADLANIARLADAGEHGVVRRRLQNHVPTGGTGRLARILVAIPACFGHQHRCGARCPSTRGAIDRFGSGAQVACDRRQRWHYLRVGHGKLAAANILVVCRRSPRSGVFV